MGNTPNNDNTLHVSIDTHSGVSSVNKIRFSRQDDNVAKQLSVDMVSVEEPLQISIIWQNEAGEEQEKDFMVTMRTPGDDPHLAIGLLNTEGIIASASDVVFAKHVDSTDQVKQNWLEVKLAPGISPDWLQYQRNMAVQSSCGICGKTSLQAIELKSPPVLDKSGNWLPVETVVELSHKMRAQQVQFQQTGGVHAVGLFNKHGELQLIKEDVGRHNAMDKLIGANLLNKAEGKGQERQSIVVLSGRVSFELVQKALMAGFEVIVAVGAPSSLAISVAQRFNITLIGFVSCKGFNIYHGAFRLQD